MRSAGTPRSSSTATRAASVVVLPVPAPARISSGPPSCSAAARCSAFRASSQPVGEAAVANMCSSIRGGSRTPPVVGARDMTHSAHARRPPPKGLPAVLRSSLVAVGAAVLVLAPTAVAATGMQTVSFRNSRPELPDDVYRAQLQAARAFSCLPALPPGMPAAAGPADAQRAEAHDGRRRPGHGRERRRPARPPRAQAAGAGPLPHRGRRRAPRRRERAPGLGEGRPRRAPRHREPQPARPAAADRRRRPADRRGQAERGAGPAGEGADAAAAQAPALRPLDAGHPGDEPLGGPVPDRAVRGRDRRGSASAAQQHLARRGTRERRHGPALHGQAGGGRSASSARPRSARWSRARSG